MKKFLAKLNTIIALIVLFLVVSECASLYHDKTNPCTPGPYENGIDCENWKQDYPKEYKKYQERMRIEPKSN